MNIKRTGKLLIIGWDAAEWGVIEPLIQEGKMPALQKLISEGCYARLKTMDPPLSPMLWTSIATGVRADRHGVCGFVEPLPDGEGLRPVTSTSRKVKAFWNIFTQENIKSNIIGWWPSNPVEKINGIMVSNLYQVANKPLGEEWKMPDGTIHPKELEDTFKEFRVHPAEITPHMVLPFVPNIKDNFELRKDKRTLSIAKIIAHAASVHAASTYAMMESEWDVTAIYHDAIDHFSHVAMKYHPPRRDFINEEEYENYKFVVEAGYRYHDMMLERTLDLIDDETTVVLLSDHGFFPDHRRPKSIPKEPSGPAIEHSPFGILVMKGPGVKKGGIEFSGASVLDITPTLLTLLGLPVGKDMEGKVLYQSFEDPTAADFIDSWENVVGDSGMHDLAEIEDPWAAQEALQQLVELGYIDALDDDKLDQVEKAKQESDYYVARNMIDGGRIDNAIPILERIFKETNIVRYGQRLAYAYLTKREYNKVREVIEQLRLLEKKEIEELILEKKERNPEDPFFNGEFEEPLYLDFIEGLTLLALNQQKKALSLLEKVQKKNQNSFEVPMNIAKIYLLRKNYKLAEKQYIKALALDDRSALAHHGLGVCFLRQGDLDHAIEEFLLALESNFYVPNVHYHLGEALFRAGDFKEAVNALELAVRMAPGMTKARKLLINLYSDPIENSMKLREHEDFLKNKIRGELIVVTGLEGSGFENVLKQLNEYGVRLIFEEADIKAEEREAFEFSKVKSLSYENDLLKGSEVKAMHVNIQLLPHLPEDVSYKVIIVKRDLSEVLKEQREFLNKKIIPDSLYLKHLGIIQKLQDQLDSWVASKPSLPRLELSYEELVENPDDQKAVLQDFIGIDSYNS